MLFIHLTSRPAFVPAHPLADWVVQINQDECYPRCSGRAPAAVVMTPAAGVLASVCLSM